MVYYTPILLHLLHDNGIIAIPAGSYISDLLFKISSWIFKTTISGHDFLGLDLST